MPPDTPPPDDERRPPASSSSEGGNVVDPAVLAERRAQRAEQAEHSAERRAADAQVLAAQLARERARLEAERDAARAEAAAAREGADAAIAEARHLQAERDTLRDALIEARRERDQLVAAASAPAEAVEPATVVPPAEVVEPATTNGNGRNGHAASPAAWAVGLRRELAVARSAAAVAVPSAPLHGPSTVVPALARERRLLEQRAARGPVPAAKPVPASVERRSDRAAPITALALERERSSRLQAQLDASLAVQRELRTHIAALQRAIHQRVEAERRIETALRRVREELTAANALAAGRVAPAQSAPATGPAPPSAPPRAAAGSAAPSSTPMPPASTLSDSKVGMLAQPSTAPEAAVPPARAGAAELSAPVERPAAPPVPALDPLRLSAAHERLRASVAPAEDEEPAIPLPAGPPRPWLPDALRRLLATEPETAGRIVVGLLPAHGLAAERPLRYDLLLTGRGCLAVDVTPGAPAAVAQRPAPRPRSDRDLSIAGDAVGVARLLHGRRTLLRRPARVRGGRRAMRELRRIAQAPLTLRDVGAAGVALDPVLALRLVALAIDAEATRGRRFAIAHAPLAGGPVDAWLRIADGAEPTVVTQPPPEPTRLTLRCTRGALLALIAGVDPPPGESGTLDGDDVAPALLRAWIARTEHPVV